MNSADNNAKRFDALDLVGLVSGGTIGGHWLQNTKTLVGLAGFEPTTPCAPDLYRSN